MKLTLGWLRDHLATVASADEIAAALTDVGLEVEALTDPARLYDSFVIARVLAAEPHPQADRLTVCRVDTGSGEAQVVCGAPNAREGLVGVFAPPGVRIPGTGVDLKAASIRGVDSRGMLLSERELGISDEHDGIVDLPADAPVGTAYARYMGLDDPVLTVGVTPNRPDALGVRGIARDLAARGVGTLRPLPVADEPQSGAYSSPVGVALAPEVASAACPLFVGRHFRGLVNGASPDWMQRRLRAIGLRPISALVDITNYLTYDLCRPLHAFDADKLTGDILVRPAQDGETLSALDGRTYTLQKGMTVIADSAGAQGLGGVIGGVDTACDEATKSVLLESASFDPVRTAITGRVLGISSDARFRFERGVDPGFARAGMEVAARLILEICGGEASALVIAGAPPAPPASIRYRIARVRLLLGMEVPRDEQIGILRALGFEVEGEREILTVTPPSWRADVAGEADIVEEVARIASLGRIEAVALPRRRPGVAPPALGDHQKRLTLARRALAGRGMHECVSYTFVPAEAARRFGGEEPALALDNPISTDLAVMRPSVLPSLLAAAARNRARGWRDFSLFEVGPVFEGGEPGEQRDIAAALRVGEVHGRAWNQARRGADAFDAKADCLALARSLGGNAARLEARSGAPDWYHPGRSGSLGYGPGQPLAFFGEIHPRTLAEYDLDGPVAAFEFRIGDLPRSKRVRRARPPLEASNFQAVERDFAFTVRDEVPADEVVRAARSADRALIESVRVFDLFAGERARESLGEGMKSLAICVRLQPREGTLDNAAIEAVSREVVARVEKATGGRLRG